MLKTKDFALNVKNLTDEGVFEGYASVFGNVDSYGEKVVPGAFVDSLAQHRREGTAVLMLWQHNPENPIGVWDDMAEDGKGLWGKGRLLLDVQSGREAYIRVKAGAVRGLSIGYREEDTDQENGVRLLKKVALKEVSIVTFAANRRARIESVKNENMEEFARRLRDGEPPTIKEFEDILREAGIPKSMATAIASHGYAKAIRSESEGEKAKKTVQFLEALRNA